MKMIPVLKALNSLHTEEMLNNSSSVNAEPQFIHHNYEDQKAAFFQEMLPGSSDTNSTISEDAK